MIPTLEKLCAHEIFVASYLKYRFDDYYEKIPSAISSLNIPKNCKRKILKRLKKIPHFDSKQKFIEYFYSTPDSKKDFYLMTYYISKYDLINLLLNKINNCWDFKLLTKYLLKSDYKDYDILDNDNGTIRVRINQTNIIQQFPCKKNLINVIKRYSDKQWDLNQISEYEERKKCVHLIDDDEGFDYYNFTSKLKKYNGIKLFVQKPDKNWDFQKLSKYYSELPKEDCAFAQQLYNDSDDEFDSDNNFSDSDDEYHYRWEKKERKVINTLIESTGNDYSTDLYRDSHISNYYETLHEFRKQFKNKINEDWDYNLLIDEISNEFINNNLDYDWDYNLMIKKIGLNLDVIEKIFKKIDYNELSDIIPVEKLIQNIDYDWDYNKLSKRCFDSRWWCLVCENKNKPWNLRILNNKLLQILDLEVNDNIKINFLRMKDDILIDKDVWSIINMLNNYLWDEKIINHAKSLGIEYKKKI